MLLAMGIIVGTALIFDLFYRKIPNELNFAGLALVFANSGRMGMRTLGFTILYVLFYFSILILVYYIGALGAGDVKLLIVLCSFLGLSDGIKYLALVFITGGCIGIIRILYNFSEHLDRNVSIEKSFTKIRFTIPITISYFILLISKGGIY